MKLQIKKTIALIMSTQSSNSKQKQFYMEIEKEPANNVTEEERKISIIIYRVYLSTQEIFSLIQRYFITFNRVLVTNPQLG